MNEYQDQESWFRAERLNPDSRKWEYVGDADTEQQASELRPKEDYAEYRIRKMRGQA